MIALNPGDKAPEFEGRNQNNETVKLKDYRGKKVVLYFYPEDDTELCTIEACNLRDNFSDLRAAGYEVIGVSPDDVASHDKFVKKYSLTFTLIADPDKKIANLYGVWGEKNMYGKIVIGMKRSTFLIDEKGNIERVIKRVISKKATEQILQA